VTAVPVVDEVSAGGTDIARVNDLLAQFAAITEAGPGVTRLAYTTLEREAHAVFTSFMKNLGLKVWTDSVGNTIAERPGTHGGRSIGTGSHLDSVPNAGRFDGIVGVVSALEVARIITERGIEHRHPIRFVAFAGEEGARFGQACTGSKLVAGLCTEEELDQRFDKDGISIAQAMRSVDLHPERLEDSLWSRDDWAAFVELHVEQGAVLERSGVPIGVVDLISGSTRIEIEIKGQASHTGATPMNQRADALTAAAEIVLLAESIASDTQHRGTRATVGKLEVRPGSITTIPGSARLAVDVRDVDSDRQRHTATELLARAQAACDRRGVIMTHTVLADASPVVLPVWVRQVVAGSCVDAGLRYRVMTSGASHDAQMVNQVVPTGMIFVPSKDGISHDPAEWTAPADIVVGIGVLLQTLLTLDKRV
jgi:allantoate deiminase